MIRLSQLKGQRVLAQDNAQIVGSVRRLLLDPNTARITGVELEGVTDGRGILEWPALAIGPDSLMVASSDDRRGPLDENDRAFISGALDLEGKLVLDEGGDAIGKLTDIAFDEKTGRLIELEVPGRVVPIDGVVALGIYALIIPVPGAI